MENFRLQTSTSNLLKISAFMENVNYIREVVRRNEKNNPRDLQVVVATQHRPYQNYVFLFVRIELRILQIKPSYRETTPFFKVMSYIFMCLDQMYSYTPNIRYRFQSFKTIQSLSFRYR